MDKIATVSPPVLEPRPSRGGYRLQATMHPPRSCGVGLSGVDKKQLVSGRRSGSGFVCESLFVCLRVFRLCEFSMEIGGSTSVASTTSSDDGLGSFSQSSKFDPA